MAKKVNGKSIKAKVGKRPQDWTAAEKLEAVLESASLSEQELGEYLRRKGGATIRIQMNKAFAVSYEWLSPTTQTNSCALKNP